MLFNTCASSQANCKRQVVSKVCIAFSRSLSSVKNRFLFFWCCAAAGGGCLYSLWRGQKLRGHRTCTLLLCSSLYKRSCTTRCKCGSTATFKHHLEASCRHVWRNSWRLKRENSYSSFIFSCNFLPRSSQQGTTRVSKRIFRKLCKPTRNCNMLTFFTRHLCSHNKDFAHA